MDSIIIWKIKNAKWQAALIPIQSDHSELRHPVPDDCLTTACWLPNNCLTTAWQLLNMISWTKEFWKLSILSKTTLSSTSAYLNLQCKSNGKRKKCKCPNCDQSKGGLNNHLKNKKCKMVSSIDSDSEWSLWVETPCTWRLPDDCLTTDWWLLNKTTAWRLYDDCLTTACQMPDNKTIIHKHKKVKTNKVYQYSELMYLHSLKFIMIQVS